MCSLIIKSPRLKFAKKRCWKSNVEMSNPSLFIYNFSLALPLQIIVLFKKPQIQYRVSRSLWTIDKALCEKCTRGLGICKEMKPSQHSFPPFLTVVRILDQFEESVANLQILCIRSRYIPVRLILSCYISFQFILNSMSLMDVQE